MSDASRERFDLPRPALIGVLHLKPLPGSPRYGDAMEGVVAAARADAEAYLEGGVDALVIENFGDTPFTGGRVASETIAAMAVVAAQLTPSWDKPFGFNVLRNDADAALALAAVTGGSFIRINVHTGAMVTDQGLIEGDAYATLRKRAILASRVAIWADVLVKHAYPVGADPDPAEAARETHGRGLADALVVSGRATGEPVDLQRLRSVRQACPGARVFVGSGVGLENAGPCLAWADGLIVGTSLKRDGILANPVDAERVRRLRQVMDTHSSSA